MTMTVAVYCDVVTPKLYVALFCFEFSVPFLRALGQWFANLFDSSPSYQVQHIFIAPLKTGGHQ